MHNDGSQLVDLVRDFLAADRRLRDLFDRFRKGVLQFEEVPGLVGEDRQSLLFRLKERTHALFRSEGPDGEIARPRQALFDLAVGSLFHEAMKVRENLYQTEVYAPKVRRLQASAGPESGALFRDFEKILSAAESRLCEAIDETEGLLDHTRQQFRLLLVDYRDEPLIARTLFLERRVVDEVFHDGLDAVLAEVYGDAAAGYVAAARSYLASAYFDEALAALSTATGRGRERPEFERLTAYAEGMKAFQTGRYAHSLERLRDWVDAGPGPDERQFALLAHSAVAKVGDLVDPAERAEVAPAAAELARHLAPIAKAL